ncbi:MAG: 7-cyano-7-deazaguanine synthase QueC [Euryarchaeota archaeon]|jgi:queuosine biosynthesis protein QueC|nr:7-cyano-7-deazaguanine synthase QueC [Euryarchaeota archaeon]
MSRAVVLLSAGLDSVVSFKIAFDTFDEIRCLTFDYAQKANRIEIEYATKICALYGVDHQIIKLPWYASFIGALTSQTAPPRMSDSALNDLAVTRDTARAVWVPARNAVFLSIAAAFCENFAFNTVVVGFNKEEAMTFPDNSTDFVASFNEVLKYATLNEVEVFAPLNEYDKSEIAALGLRIGAPLEWSWSCYAAEGTPCCRCESCLRRRRAFQEICKDDPLLKRLRSRR